MRQSKRILRTALALAAGLAGIWRAQAQIEISNGTNVNVTPSSFSVVATVSPPAAAAGAVSVSVFADPMGMTNLAGEVGVELYPLNSGALGATNDYQRRQSEAALQKQSMALGIVQARVSDCLPNTKYYYRLKVTATNGQSAVWPSGAPAAVTTASANAFTPQSSQLLITVYAADATGSILTLADTNSGTILAAVVGDGAPSNQAYFSVNDLTSLNGNTNFAPLGNQTFTASLLGFGGGFAQQYALVFSNNFSVGQGAQFSVGAGATVTMGQTYQRAGGSGNVPITVTSLAPLTAFSFVVNVPTNLFTGFSVQVDSPLIGSGTVQAISASALRFNFQAAAGTNLQGTTQIAQLNYSLAANDESAFIVLAPQTLAGTNADFSMPNLAGQPGRIIIVGTQPVLQAELIGGTRALALYGVPGDTYQIQASTDLRSAANWTNVAQVSLTNDLYIITNLNNAPAVFYRAYH